MASVEKSVKYSRENKTSYQVFQLKSEGSTSC
jgi:hypothetical protein